MTDKKKKDEKQSDESLELSGDTQLPLSEGLDEKTEKHVAKIRRRLGQNLTFLSKDKGSGSRVR
ncbi:MAG TPA: hypothetical protein VE988_22390 [Gemmataceae bacterium]|nr:hypothetical protein [Gemmataceae bacterium]